MKHINRRTTKEEGYRISPDYITHRFYGSREWKLWEKEVERRMLEHTKKRHKIYHGCWDTSESMECRLMSETHWDDFIKFVKTLKCEHSKLVKCHLCSKIP